MSDKFFSSIWYAEFVYVSLVIYSIEYVELKDSAVKVAGDVLFNRHKFLFKSSTENIQSNCKIGTAVHSPGNFLYYGLTIFKMKQMNQTINSNYKLNFLEAYLIDRKRRKNNLKWWILSNWKLLNISTVRLEDLKLLCLFSACFTSFA